MAYLAFQGTDCTLALPRARAANPATAADPENIMSAVEWSVVAIARTDGRASLRRCGPLAIRLRSLLGRRNPRLGNPRLEALRRLAVLTWHDGECVAPLEVDAFLAAGFTHAQHAALVARIGIARAADLAAARR